MNAPRFIDTNILLYSISRDPAEMPKRDIAIALLDAEDIALSIQVLQEFYMQATRSDALSHEIAVALIRTWLRFKVQEITLPVMIPGLLLAALQIGVIKTATWFAPHWAPASPRLPWRERLRALLGMWKLLFIFLLSIGGIYAGWFSPTEAAAVGTFVTIIIAALGGQLTLRQLSESVIESSRTTAMLFFILLGAIMFSYFIVQTQIATNLATWVVSLHLPATAVMVIVVLF